MSHSEKEEKLNFVFKGVEYDVSDYASKHPGGPKFLSIMRKERKDIT